MRKPTLMQLKSLPLQSRLQVLLAWFVLFGVVAWSYSLALATIVGVWWQQSDDYGHAFFVPILSLVLLWDRRHMIHPMSLQECWANWRPALLGGIVGALSGLLILVSSHFEDGTFHAKNMTWYQPVFALVYGGVLAAGLFQLVVLFLRSDTADGPFSVPGCMWGLAFIALAAVLRWAAAYLFFFFLIPLALVSWIAGLTLFMGGWRAARWAWPAIVFLVFMIPLPGILSGFSAGQLQLIGTKASVFAIQTLSIPAFADGNVIRLADAEPLDVARACSGLRMLMLFFAVCVGAALILRCPLWEKIVIVLSAAPIAIFANVVRLTVTAFAHHLVWGEWFDNFIHDFAGFMMMILGILVLWGEMTLLRKVLLDPVSKSPLPLGGPLGPGMRRPNPLPVTRQSKEH